MSPLICALTAPPKLLPVEYIVIVVYLVFLAAIGPIMKSFNKNSDDYFRGGARTKWWLIGPSLAMSITSAGVFTGVAGAIFESGLAPMASNLGQYAAGILLIGFMAAWFRQLRKITPAEVVRERFGPATEQFFSYLNMCMQPIYGSFQLLGLSIFVAAVFQIPLEVMVLVLGAVVGFYSVSGGKWAVMATDFLQSLILQTVVIAVGVLAIMKLGGIGGAIDAIGQTGGFNFSYPEGAYSDGRYTMAWIIAVFSMQFIAQLQLGWSARFFMAKDGKEARKATALMFAILIAGTVFFMAIPLAARVLYQQQVGDYADVLNKPEEAAYVVACLNLLPAGMMGMVLVAMFSATASSMDSGLNANAAVIVRNIMPPLRRFRKWKELDGQTELVWGRRVTVVLAVAIVSITLGIAYFGRGGIFELMLNFAQRVQFPMSLPFFLVLFIRNAPRCSALFSIAAGFIGPFVAFPLYGLLSGAGPDFAERLAIVAACSLFGFALSYVAGPKDSQEGKEQTRQFYADMHRPVDFEKEIGGANDNRQLVMIGTLAIAIGSLMLLLLIVPNPFKDRATILCMGGFVFLLGLLMRWFGKRGQARGND